MHIVVIPVTANMPYTSRHLSPFFHHILLFKKTAAIAKYFG